MKTLLVLMSLLATAQAHARFHLCSDEKVARVEKALFEEKGIIQLENRPMGLLTAVEANLSQLLGMCEAAAESLSECEQLRSIPAQTYFCGIRVWTCNVREITGGFCRNADEREERSSAEPASGSATSGSANSAGGSDSADSDARDEADRARAYDDSTNEKHSDGGGDPHDSPGGLQ